MTEPSTHLTYQGYRFNAAESDYEIWLRADGELGHALAVDPPEQAVLDLYQENLLQFSERLFRAGETRKTGGSAVPANYGRWLAWLWRNSPAEGWLEIESICRLAERTGIPRRSLKRAIGRAVAWGFAEQRPERPDDWPSDIRLVRTRLEAALRQAGLERSEWGGWS
jgi:hypothetical protein